jgi:hypothetical protein
MGVWSIPISYIGGSSMCSAEGKEEGWVFGLYPLSYIGGSSMCSAEGKEGGLVFGLNPSVTLVVPVCAVLRGRREGGCLV